MARDTAQAFQQDGMTAMNAVKVADRQCRRPRKRARKTAKDAHLMPEKRGNYSGLRAPALVPDSCDAPTKHARDNLEQFSDLEATCRP